MSLISDSCEHSVLARRGNVSEISQKTLPNGANLYTVARSESGNPDVTAFAAVLERMLENQPDQEYIVLTGYLKRALVEQLVFILGAPKGGVN
jgi:hypothetical protein